MRVGSGCKASPTGHAVIKALLLPCAKEQFKTLLDDRDLSREFEVSHDKIATVGDVVILADVFSPSSLAPARPNDTTQGVRWCGKCGAQLLQGAKHCIKCGSLLDSTDCPTCRTMNPVEAKFCKNCGGKIS